MSELAKTFFSLDGKQKHFVHLALCQSALRIWERYVTQFDEITYVEGVVGTFQVVDKILPKEAFDAVVNAKDSASINS